MQRVLVAVFQKCPVAAGWIQLNYLTRNVGDNDYYFFNDNTLTPLTSDQVKRIELLTWNGPVVIEQKRPWLSPQGVVKVGGAHGPLNDDTIIFTKAPWL
jgi:hypothetical protein